MQVKYKNEKLKNKYEDQNYIKKTFNANMVGHLNKFRERVLVANDLFHLMRIGKGFDIKSMANSTNKWRAKLNDKWRIIFNVSEDNVTITVIEINPHKYKK